MMDREHVIRKFLEERFANYRVTLSLQDSLEGVVDSLGLFDLVEFIEREFNVSIPNEDFSPRKFQSIATILATINEIQS